MNVSTENIPEYPLCSRCIFYHNAYSTVFGDAWGCSENVENSYDISENDWNVNHENLEPVPCGKYQHGEPTTTVLG